MNKRWSWIALFSLLSLFGHPKTAEAQGAEDEVYLQFRYQGVVNVYLSTIYYDDEFYISVGEFFSALSIDHTIEPGRLRVEGTISGIGRYSIQFAELIATVGSRRIHLNADQFVITEFGYYLKSDLFYELFEMDLVVSFSNLSLSMTTPYLMPVIAQRHRQVQRDRMLRHQREVRREYYPLRNGRETSFFNLGFVDYNITTNYTDTGIGLNYTTNIGTEFLGGDIQGSILGSYTETASVFRSTNLRWRYGFVDNSWISVAQAGQNRSGGLLPAAYTGIRLTNDPIEPRFLYGESSLSGTAFPNAEVELYRNNNLIDFVEADASGFYSFNVPITYGTSQYSIRSYSQGGLQDQRNLRFQIPQSFLPGGQFNYTIEGGRLDNPIAGSIERGYMGQGRFRYGLSNRVTLGTGVEYFEDFHEDLPTFSGSLSTRLFTNHLVTLQAANDAFYRASFQAIYPSNASITAEYTHFIAEGGLYNPGRSVSALRTSLFTPFQIRNFPLFFRWSFNMEEREFSTLYRYRIDLNTRIGPANLRVGFMDAQLNQMEFRTTQSARLTTAATYTFRNIGNRRNPLNNLFLRAQMNYIPSREQVEDTELQISRRIGDVGRIQLSAGRNFIGHFNLIRFNFTLDFDTFRSNTAIRSNRSGTAASQDFRGSLGYDTTNHQMFFTNRNQVGRGAVAVRLFVDNNNNGVFDEEDTLIPERAVRIERSSSRTQMRGGISYITQLQAYRQYNLVVNKSAITNPLLVPITERFSFITDPNQFKTIDIPFYTSGIAEGMIYRVRYGEREGLGGLRIYMVQVNVPEGTEGYREELRTFSDGSFYQFEIPPGDYEIRVDQTQLDFLNVKAEPEILEFTIRPLSEGDFAENLVIDLVPRDPFEDSEETADPDADPTTVSDVIEERVETEDFPDEREQGRDAILTDEITQPVVEEQIAEMIEEQDGEMDISLTDTLLTNDELVVADETDRIERAEDVPVETVVDTNAIAEDSLDIGRVDDVITEDLAEVILQTEKTDTEDPADIDPVTDDAEEELLTQEHEEDSPDASLVFEEQVRSPELAEDIIRDPNAERTVSDIEIFTQDANCRFSIQMAEYRTLEEAFNGANRYELQTGMTFRVYSAGPQDQFRIRTPENDFFGEVLSNFNDLLSQSPGEKPAIITQCQDHEQSGPLRYYIQLGAFSSISNAEALVERLRDQYELPSRIDDSDGRLNRVQAGPFQNRRDLLEAFRQLANDHAAPGMYIMVDPDSYYNVNLEYRLQVGIFSDPRDAVRYAFEISEAFEVDTFVIVDGSAFKVMVNKNYEMWDDVFRDFAMISAYDSENNPAIHLQESDQ